MRTLCKPILSAALLALAWPTMAQTAIDEPAQISLPGITFTSSLNGAAQATAPDGDGLVMTGGPRTDFFREPDGSAAYGNAPVLLTPVDNTRPFTFTARVAPVLTETYDAGTLYAWVRDDLWLKMALERDERGLARIVTVRTAGTSDDNNHDVVAAPAAFMRISSDTRSIGFYYSTDGEEWQLVRLFRNDYGPTLRLGISAQSPLGAGTTARFDSFTLTQQAVANFRMGE